MINDQYSPEEQAIIQQIQATPRLERSASAREAIHSRMLNEFRLVGQQSTSNPVSQTRLVPPAVTALIVVTVIVIIILAIISSQNTGPQTATAPDPAISYWTSSIYTDYSRLISDSHI